MVEVDDLFVSRAVEEGELESHQSCKGVALLGTRQIVLLYTSNNSSILLHQHSYVQMTASLHLSVTTWISASRSEPRRAFRVTCTYHH